MEEAQNQKKETLTNELNELLADTLIMVDINPIEAIYVLISNNIVIYAGQTRNLHIRLSEHRRKMKFDSVRYFNAKGLSRVEMMDLELHLIEVFNPRYNSMWHVEHKGFIRMNKWRSTQK